MKLYAACKRRKPQDLRPGSDIHRDPHDKKKYMLSFSCNDGWFNASDPIKVLNVLGNGDDKALIPPSFIKPPKFKWDNNEPVMTFHTAPGVLYQEYILK